MSLVNVTTAPERIVKDMRGNKVPAQFSVNPDDPFWARLMAAGDIVAIGKDGAEQASEAKQTSETGSTVDPAASSVTPSKTPANSAVASNKEAAK